MRGDSRRDSPRSPQPCQPQSADVVLASFASLARSEIPGAEVTIRKPRPGRGEWRIAVQDGGFATTVTWTEDIGFGFRLDEAAQATRPSEAYGDPKLAAIRLRMLRDAFLAHGALAAMSLADVRKLIGRKQRDVAVRLVASQASVSRLESRRNPTLGTLRDFVEAIGGQLEVRVRFPEVDVQLGLPPGRRL